MKNLLFALTLFLSFQFAGARAFADQFAPQAWPPGALVDPGAEAQRSEQISNAIEQKFNAEFERNGGRSYETSVQFINTLRQATGRPITQVWMQYYRQKDGTWRNFEPYPRMYTDAGIYCWSTPVQNGSSIWDTKLHCNKMNGKPIAVSEGR